MSQFRELYLPEAEQGVLGAILLSSLSGDAALAQDIVSQMTSADFYHLDNAALFDAISDCLERDMPVDPVTVGMVQRLLPSGDTTTAYAAEITSNVPSTANWKAYAQQVKKWAVIRQIIDVGRITHEGVADDLPADEIIATAQQALADLRDLQDAGANYKRLSDVVPKVLDDMDDHVNDRSPLKLSTGLADLDKLIGYLRQKTMVVIGGRPGSGKTMLALQIMQSVTVTGGGTGLIFSLEMAEEELCVRSIASLGGIDLRRMENAKDLDTEEWNRVGVAVGKIKQAEIYINDTPGLSMRQIRSIAREVKRDHGLSIMMVDYVGLVGSDGSSYSRADAVGKISTALKNLSKELGIPILVLAQLNRNPTSRPGKKPQASDLRDSGQIEQDADAVLLVHHDPESEAGENGVTEIILDKGRQAPVGFCRVQRQGQYARFVDLVGYHMPSDEEVEMKRARSFASTYKGRKDHE